MNLYKHITNLSYDEAESKIKSNNISCLYQTIFEQINSTIVSDLNREKISLLDDLQALRLQRFEQQFINVVRRRAYKCELELFFKRIV